MDAGDTMYVTAVIAAMVVFGLTLFVVAWMTNSK